MRITLIFLKYTLLLFLLIVVGFCALNWRSDLPLNELKKKYTNSESEFVEIDGIQVHFRDEGVAVDSLPLVLIHGTGASLHTWEGWVKSLKVNHRIITFDLPAYGLTEPNKTGDYSQEYYVDFVDKLLGTLSVKKCILGGNSLGGGITWAYALAHPERVEKMILVDASGYPMVSKSVPIAFQLARLPVLNKLFQYVTPRAVVEKSVRNVYIHDERITNTLIDRYYDLALREGNRKAFIDRMRKSVLNDKYLKIKGLRLKTLIIWGQQDGLIPITVGEQFHQDLANDTMVVFKDLGHTPMEEDPESTVKAVLNFLDKK